jgi:shikimate dehydrogenase
MSVYPWQAAPEAEFAVIGDPVAHSLSPWMQSAALRALRLPYRYVAILVPPGDLMAAMDRLEALGYQGVNVTVPHKSQVLDWVRDAEPYVGRVGACNTVRMKDRFGWNTDAPGFLQVLEELEVPPDAPLLVLGAGGSTRALLPALVERGHRVRLWNRTRARADALVEELGLDVVVQDQPEAGDAAVVVNATSASLQGASLGVEWHEAKLAIDLAYRARMENARVVVEPTPFLREAVEAGIAAVDGRALLAAQGALSLGYWLERAVDPAPMRQALGLPASPPGG